MYWVGFHIYETDTGLTWRWDGTQYVPVWYAAGRNMIDNGEMLVCQRENQKNNNNLLLTPGTSAFGIDRGADRWEVINNTTASVSLYPSYAFTAVQDPTPAGTGMIMQVGAATLGSLDWMYVRQSLLTERLREARFGHADAKPLTVSFWASTSVAGTYIVELEVLYPVQRVSAAYTLAANVWTYVTMTFPAATFELGLVPSDPMGSGYYENYTVGLNFWLAAGSSFSANGTLGTTWNNTGNGVRAFGQTNWLTTAGQFTLTKVQMEVGPVATPFERLGFAAIKAECLRHYWRHGAQGTDGYAPLAFGQVTADTIWVGTVQMPVPMIKPPTFGYSGYFRMTDEVSTTAVGSMDGFVHSSATMVFIHTTFASFGAPHTPLWLECNNDPAAYLRFACGG